MIFQQGIDALARQSALDPLSDAVQRAIRGAYGAAGTAGRRIANLMYGTWLGHPLHPALTDLAIGAWGAASVFDGLDAAIGHRVFSRCADGALAAGTVAGTAATLSGLTDVQHVRAEAGRVGMVHGITNIVVTLMQAGSLVQRGRGARGAGRLTSLVAYASLLASAYLGGELVSKYRIGVNRAPVDGVPSGYVPVLPEAELGENEPRQVEVSGVPVVLVRQGAQVYALHATCTHLGGPLAEGQVVGDTLQCPWHGSRFALQDGRVVGGPASFPERCLATRVRNGQIEVGPGSGLGRCQHEPVSTPAVQPQAAAERMYA